MMWRRFLVGCVAPLTLTVAFCLPAAQAQTTVPRGASQMGGDDSSSSEKGSEKTPAFQYLMAALYALAIMVVVCMPSRKA